MSKQELVEKMAEKDKRIAELIIQGFSYEEISKELGISPAAIVKRMKKYSGLE